MTQGEKFISEMFYGFHVRKNGPFYSPLCGSIPHWLCNPKNKISQPYEGGKKRKSSRRYPDHSTLTKKLPSHGENKGNCCNMRKNTLELQKMHEEERMCMNDGMGRRFWVFTFPGSQNMFSKIWWLLQFKFWTTILFPSQTLTKSTTFGLLGTKYKLGIWPLYGFSLRHLVEHYWLKVWISPPLSLGNHAPISLLLHWHI